MSEFKREERYTVVKHKDISQDKLDDLRNYLAMKEIPTRTCVVVEPDWPIYGLVWSMVESIASGKVPIDPKVLAADLDAALERASYIDVDGLRVGPCMYRSLKEQLSEALEREQAMAEKLEKAERIGGMDRSAFMMLCEAIQKIEDAVGINTGGWNGPGPAVSAVQALVKDRLKRDLIKQAEALEEEALTFKGPVDYCRHRLNSSAARLRQKAAALDGKGE